MIIVRNPRKRQIAPRADPKCQDCGGKGSRIVETDGDGLRSRSCGCVAESIVDQNLEQTWKYMANRVQAVAKTPLTDLEKSRSFLWIVADQYTLASHLKCCMVDKCFDEDLFWWVDVTNDKEIVEAWLHTAKLRGEEIYDADVAVAPILPGQANSIKELAMRAQLMVIQLDKKQSPNRETDTTFIEAVEYRIDNDLPVWLAIDPDASLDDVMANSERLQQDLRKYKFKKVTLGKVNQSSSASKTSTPDVDELLNDDSDEDIGGGFVPPTLGASTGQSSGKLEKQTYDPVEQERAQEREAKAKKFKKKSLGNGKGGAS